MKKDIPIPAEIFYDKRLGHSERMVLIALYSFSNPTTSIAKPSLKGLCLRAGFKSQSSIKTCLRNLEKHDWIQVKAKKGSPNQYKLSTQPIFGGTLEEGRALPSTTYSLTKLKQQALPNTHTQDRESYEQQRPCHEDSEEVQLGQDETNAGHDGHDGDLVFDPVLALGGALTGKNPSGIRPMLDED